MKDIVIIDAKAEDAEEIREIAKQTWVCTYPNDQYGITKEDLEARFRFSSTEEEKSHHAERKKIIAEDETQHYWVAKDGSKVIAFCLARKKEERNILQALHVLPHYQGKGIGKALMKEALSWLGSDKDIELTATTYNERAIKFYEKFGFVKTVKETVNETARLPSGTYIPQIEMVRDALKQ